MKNKIGTDKMRFQKYSWNQSIYPATEWMKLNQSKARHFNWNLCLRKRCKYHCYKPWWMEPNVTVRQCFLASDRICPAVSD